jgi:hypothetical protein
MIQLDTSRSAAGSGVQFAGSSEDLDALRADFERQHCIRLPGFLTSSLLERIQGYIRESEFSHRSLVGRPPELIMESGKAPQLLMLLMNDSRLFELVRTITGCRRIGSCDGSVYRMMPGRGHMDRWHGEIFGHHMIAVGVDLSERPYAGGTLEIRDRYSHRVLHRVGGGEPGDATLVRLAPFLQRRITAVEGDFPRTVYAARFMLLKPSTYSKLARPPTRD